MGFLDDLGLPVLSGISNDFFGNILFWGQIIGVVIAIGIVGVIVYNSFYRWNMRVTLTRNIGRGGVKIITDNARIMTDSDGSKKLVLFRTRHGKDRLTTAIPPSEYRTLKGKRDHYFYHIDDNYNLQPIQVIGDSEHRFLRMFPEDKLFWARKEDKRRLLKYLKVSALEKYLPSIIVIAAFLFTFLIAYFGFSYIGEGLGQLATQFGQVASACTAL